MPRTGPTILIVDDDENVALYIKLRLSYLEHSDIVAVGNSLSALVILQHQPIDLLITDFAMPGMNGVTLAERAQEIQPDLPILMISAASEMEIRAMARAARIDHILAKPFSARQLCAQVEKLLPDSAVRRI